MQAETVQTHAQPWVYLSYQTPMDSERIGQIMGDAFGKLGQFIGEKQVEVAGPALSVYRDYTENGMTVDIGFPVAAAALAKATGDIKAGQTPSGKAIKVVHKGSYQRLRDTYGEIEEHFKTKGIPMSAMSWEVYVNDPNSTPEDDLVTEIFMKVD